MFSEFISTLSVLKMAKEREHKLRIEEIRDDTDAR